MSLLDKAERHLGRFAIPNLTLYLVFFQSAAVVLIMARGMELYEALALIPALVQKGEWWRLISFVMTPPTLNPLWALFALYFFYLMGSALEGYWGKFRYNLFLLTGYAATVAAAWAQPQQPASTAFLSASVFLAFAWLYPDFIIYLFFILPIRIKWMALITWVGFGAALILGDAATRILVVASLANFFLFFGAPIVRRMRYGGKHMAEQAQAMAHRNQPFHICAVCGITDKTHPKMDFRYCPDCVGSPGYCEEHINHHVHRTAAK